MPFRLNDFKPLKSPLQVKKIDWDNIPALPLQLDKVEAKPFLLQKSLLPKPTLTRAVMPRLMPNTTSGILQFAVEEGLPGLVVTASLVDRHGMIWIATNKGLCRYSGENLYLYSIVHKTPQGEDYATTHLVEDRSGRIWLTTAGDGLYCMDLDQGILLHDRSSMYGGSLIFDHSGKIWIAAFSEGLFLVDPDKATIKNIILPGDRTIENLALTVKEDKRHNIWIASPDHISIIDSARQSLKKITRKEGLTVEFPLCLFEDSNSNMWIGSYSKGANFISLNDKTIHTLDSTSGFNGYGIIYNEDNQGRIWILRKDTAYLLNKEKSAIKNIVTTATMVNQINGRLLLGTCLNDVHGNVWIGSVDKGMVIIDPDGPLPENLDAKNGLSDNNVWGVLQDKNDKIWIGTHNGVNIYDPHREQIRYFEKVPVGENRITRMSLVKDNSIILSGKSGFAVVNQSGKTITRYGTGLGTKSFDVDKALQDSLNRVWINTFRGIAVYDIDHRSLKRLNKINGLLSNITWDIAADPRGYIWVGSDSGLILINPANSTLKYLRAAEGLCNNIVQKILFRENGEVWIATQNGISVIDSTRSIITNLTAREGLAPQSVYDLAEQNGKIFAGSSDGLIVVSPPHAIPGAGTADSGWNFVNYGKREGFPFNDYNQNTGAAAWHGQTWWGITPVMTVATQTPLTDTSVPRVYITRMNIMEQSPSFVTFAALNKRLTDNDTIWDESKSKFYIKDNLPQDAGYLVNNDIRWDSVTPLFKLPVNLSLPYHQNAIGFSFTNNDIQGREKIVYRYILEGIDENWSDITDRAFSKNYFNLPPGQYRFKVATKGFNGIWSSTDELSFTIRSPWWQTWWAFLLYILAAIFITTAYARYRSRKLQRENIELEHRIKERTAELSRSLDELKATQAQLLQSEKMASLGELTAGIAHEIQNPLNFVNNFSDVNKELLAEMKEEIGLGNLTEVKALADDIIANEEKINHHGKRADSIVKGMLQHSRSNSGQKELTDINALADEYLRLSFHGLRAKDKSFNATLKTDYDETIQKINIVPQDIGRVLLNLYNNAFYAVNEKRMAADKELPTLVKLTTLYQPTVSVATKSLGRFIEIKVRDNGNGIPPDIIDKIFQPFFTTKPTGQGTGLGLSLSYDIIKAHQGEIRVNSSLETGNSFTEFVIQVPTGREA